MKLVPLAIGSLALVGVAVAAYAYLNPPGKSAGPKANVTAAGAPQRPGPGQPPNRAAGRPQLPPAPVVVAPVRIASVPVTIATIGSVQAYSSVAIKSQVDGQIMIAHFKEGQAVKKGDRLFTLDRRPFEAVLRQAEANLAKDRALLAKANADLARYAALVERDFTSRARYDEARAAAAALEATITADQALVDAARLRLEYADIRAPIDGRVGSILVHPGNLVKANDIAALVVINQTRPINIQFALPESNLAEIRRRLALGQIKVRATVPEDAGPPVEGVLTFVNNAVDSATGTILLKATYANADDRLTPGQFVNLAVEMGVVENAVVIPPTAIQIGQQGRYVFVIKADSTAEVRLIQIGVATPREVVVERGLASGERVVIEGQLRLRPGARVQVRQPAAPRGPARPRNEGGEKRPNGPPE